MSKVYGSSIFVEITGKYVEVVSGISYRILVSIKPMFIYNVEKIYRYKVCPQSVENNDLAFPQTSLF